MIVRYRVGKNELIGRTKELDIMDLEDEGIEFIELRWTRFKKVKMYEQICGFQDFTVLRNRDGEKIDKRLINDAPIIFRPDERKVGFGYIPKTKRNMVILAGIMKNKLCRPTDSAVEKELKEIAKAMKFVTQIDLRDHSLDGVLKVADTKRKQILNRNKALKEELEVANAERENEELQKQLLAIRNVDEKEEGSAATEQTDNSLSEEATRIENERKKLEAEKAEFYAEMEARKVDNKPTVQEQLDAAPTAQELLESKPSVQEQLDTAPSVDEQLKVQKRQVSSRPTKKNK